MRLVSPSGLIATTVALGAVVAPSAQAGAPPGAPPILRPAQPSEVSTINRAQEQKAQRFYYKLPRTARYSSAEMNAFARAVNPVADPTVASDASGSGFDYGDAAVGAAITGGIALLIAAGLLTMRRRRHLRYP